MRVLLTLALVGQCGVEGRQAGPPAAITGIHVETSEGASTGDPEVRLDLGAWEPWTTGESTGGSSGGEESTGGDFPTTGSSSGAASESTGGESTGDDSTGSTGAGSTSSGSSTSETSTGGDYSTGEPLTDCPCEDGADNVCDLAPGTCSATMPGGYCDPNGDGAYFDGDFNLGWKEYQAKCA